MPTLALTGPTGVGKSTLQDQLVLTTGAWTPPTFVTRPAAGTEKHVQYVDPDSFQQKILQGELVLPQYFGGHWYAWSRNDVDRLKQTDDVAVINIRPYTALALQTLLCNVLAVWLFLDVAELERRRGLRGEHRDQGDLAMFRSFEEQRDAQYESLFSVRVRADQHALGVLADLLGGAGAPH